MNTVTEHAIFEIAAPALLYPRVYAPAAHGKPESKRYEQFSVTFDAELMPPAVRLRLHRSTLGKPTLTAKSNSAPLVSEQHGRYELVAMLFQEADVRNITRDRLLKGIPATAALTTADVEHFDLGKFDTLVLLAITVDVDDMRAKMKAITDGH